MAEERCGVCWEPARAWAPASGSCRHRVCAACLARMAAGRSCARDVAGGWLAAGAFCCADCGRLDAEALLFPARAARGQTPLLALCLACAAAAARRPGPPCPFCRAS